MPLDTNACSNNPCLNGATCQPTGTGSTYTCTCAPGYSGTNCQICNNFNTKINFNFKIKKKLIDNACYNNPCLNGATCQTTGSSYTCTCTAFYSGTNCQTCKF